MTVLTRPPVQDPPAPVTPAPAPEKPRSRSHTRIALQKLRREGFAMVLGTILFFLVILPLLYIVVAAFMTSVPRPGNTELGRFTLENFGILATEQGLQSLLNSLIVGVGSAFFALVIGAALAFIAARTDAPWQKFIYTAGIAPMFFPAIVGALAWSILGSPSSGHINLFFREIGLPWTFNVNSYVGLILVLSLYYAPYTFMLTYNSFSMMNSELEEAAAVHGAGLGRMFRTVTLPLAIPALAGAAILNFVLAVENFPVNAILGNPGGIETLPTYIYRLMVGDPQPNRAAAIAIALTLAVALVTWGQQRIVNRKRFTTLTGKGARPKRVPLRRMRWVATGFAICYFLLAVAMPFFALVFTSMSGSVYVTSFTDLFSRGFTFDRLAEAIGQADFQQSTLNSIILGVLAAILGTALAFAASYVRFRTKSRLGESLEQVSMAPLAVPQIVLGMGILWAWLALPVSVYGTIIILVIATVAVNMPQAYRSVSSSMLQLDSDLENSARMLGAGRFRAIRNVTAPLMRTGIISTLLLLLMLGLREMSAILFLYTSNTRVLSILMFNSFENGSISYAAAISLVFVLIIAVLAIATQLIGIRERKHKNPTA